MMRPHSNKSHGERSRHITETARHPLFKSHSRPLQPLRYHEMEDKDNRKSLTIKENLERQRKLDIPQMKNFILSTVTNGIANKDLGDIKFYIMHCNTFGKSLEGDYVPAEIAIAEFTIKSGVTKIYHTLINPGFVVFDNINTAQDRANFTHRLPLPPTARGETKLCKVISDIFQFIKYDPSRPTFVQFYALSKSTAIIENVLASMTATKNTPRVLSAEYLFSMLKRETLIDRSQPGIDDFLHILDGSNGLTSLNKCCSYHYDLNYPQGCSRMLVNIYVSVFCEEFDLEKRFYARLAACRSMDSVNVKPAPQTSPIRVASQSPEPEIPWEYLEKKIKKEEHDQEETKVKIKARKQDSDSASRRSRSQSLERGARLKRNRSRSRSLERGGRLKRNRSRSRSLERGGRLKRNRSRSRSLERGGRLKRNRSRSRSLERGGRLKHNRSKCLPEMVTPHSEALCSRVHRMPSVDQKPTLDALRLRDPRRRKTVQNAKTDYDSDSQSRQSHQSEENFGDTNSPPIGGNPSPSEAFEMRKVLNRNPSPDPTQRVDPRTIKTSDFILKKQTEELPQPPAQQSQPINNFAHQTLNPYYGFNAMYQNAYTMASYGYPVTGGFPAQQMMAQNMYCSNGLQQNTYSSRPFQELNTMHGQNNTAAPSKPNPVPGQSRGYSYAPFTGA